MVYLRLIVLTRADQLLPQLLMEQFDTLPSHYRKLNINMKMFDNEKLIFDKNGSFVNLDNFSGLYLMGVMLVL